jgi:aspartyl-tRNA synthetase
MNLSDFITKQKRTLYAGNVSLDHEDAAVVLMGWAHRRRDHGGVIFVDLRDREGIVQVVFNPATSPTAHNEAQRIRSEFVLAVRGIVRRHGKPADEIGCRRSDGRGTGNPQ